MAHAANAAHYGLQSYETACTVSYFEPQVGDQCGKHTINNVLCGAVLADTEFSSGAAVEKVLNLFASLGYEVQVAKSPSDFALDRCGTRAASASHDCTL
eukprot:3991812-Amphidinium_carterae.1